MGVRLTSRCGTPKEAAINIVPWTDRGVRNEENDTLAGKALLGLRGRSQILRKP